MEHKTHCGVPFSTEHKTHWGVPPEVGNNWRIHVVNCDSAACKKTELGNCHNRKPTWSHQFMIRVIWAFHDIFHLWCKQVINIRRLVKWWSGQETPSLFQDLCLYCRTNHGGSGVKTKSRHIPLVEEDPTLLTYWQFPTTMELTFQPPEKFSFDQPSAWPQWRPQWRHRVSWYPAVSKLSEADPKIQVDKCDGFGSREHCLIIFVIACWSGQKRGGAE